MIFITLVAFASLVSALATPDIPRLRVGYAGGNHAAPAAPQARGVLGDVLGGLFNPSVNAYLDAHNNVRADHGAPDLVWNTTLADKAQEWANTCEVKHSDGTLLDAPYGENIVAATGNFPIAAAIKQFTLDKSDYDAANPTYNHWTQVVWKSTTQLGCAVARCSGVFDRSLGKASYYVCLYDPAGNVIGEAP
ncbi:CAP domain-containing protein [Mycena crocata]|nr:CAP domain-containing protein [Mycena crocata]